MIRFPCSSPAIRRHPRRLFGLFAGILIWCSPLRAAETAVNAAALARVSADVNYLASDELEGRGPGTEGIQKAAEHIRAEFARLGLKSGVPDGSYFQPFEVSLGEKVVPAETHLVLQGPDDQSLTLELDRSFRPFFTGKAIPTQAPIVFVGYGISAPDLMYDDYRGVDVEGKIVLLIRREPQQESDKSAFDGRKVTQHSYLVNKLKQAADRKAAAVLMVNDPLNIKKSGQDDLMPAQGPGLRNIDLPFAQVTLETANKLLATTPLVAGDGRLDTIEAVESYIDETMLPVSQPLAGWSADVAFGFQKESAQVVNVVGVLEAEGPLAHETVVVGAHYDHLGYGGFGSRSSSNAREIHNGADDNASGTAAVLELARRLAEREQKPARRIVFAAFSAEERGLIGSSYYVNNPLFPINDTIAMLNFDMIGNLRNGELGVYGTGSGEGLVELADEVAKSSVVRIKQSDGVIAASDHYSFYQRKVPVVFFFTGLTDVYHTPADDANTLNMEGLVQVVDFSEQLVWSVARLAERPKFREVRAESPGRGGGMAYLGVTPDYAGQPGGLAISGVKPGSPAELAGLKAGDVIIRIGDVKVEDIEDLVEGLRKYKPGQVVEVLVKRDDMEIPRSVTLGEPGRN